MGVTAPNHSAPTAVIASTAPNPHFGSIAAIAPTAPNPPFAPTALTGTMVALQPLPIIFSFFCNFMPTNSIFCFTFLTI